MRWVWDNKEWLFSGVAVVAIAGLIGGLYRWLHRPKPTSPNALSIGRDGSVIGSPQASGSNITQTINIVSPIPQQAQRSFDAYSPHPSPDEIRESLERLPVYQRGLNKDSFVGLKVRWWAAFENLIRMGDAERSVFRTDATHDLSARFSDRSRIRAHVDIVRIPRLKILHEGAQIQIAGEIEYLSDDGRVIRLRGADVMLDELAREVRDESSSLGEGDPGPAARCVGEIRFDYLPGRSPEQEGWELAMDQEPSRPVFSLATDPPAAEKCLCVQGSGYRLDYVRQERDPLM